MLFASFDFLLFVIPVLAAYWGLAKHPRARFCLLVAASYFFYCASSRPVSGGLPTRWTFVGLLALTSVVDYACALFIARLAQGSFARNLVLALSLCTNLGLLCYFKYTGFLLDAARDITQALHIEAALPTMRVALPIGISFYTFQSLSYTIDVWRGRLEPERNFLRFSLFISFFPQLVAGPIVRAADFLPQLRQRLRVSVEDIDFAATKICKGLLKKVLLGDYIAASFTDLVFSTPAQYSSLENLLALYAFTLQIYADFSGYSDIAIGVARLMGFRLNENFDRPYQAQHIGDFWRRWHMTLSTWLRDYLFFPLGGSRGSAGRTYFNLWLTMFLVGMWHGASWNFVVYGNLQAAAMLYNRFVRTRDASAGLLPLAGVAVLVGAFMALIGYLALSLSWLAALGLGVFSVFIAVLNALLPDGSASRGWGLLHVLLMFHFTTLSRVFFRADNLDVAGQMASKLVEWDGLGVREGLFRMHSVYSWVQGSGALDAARAPLLALAEWGILLLLALGLVHHLTPVRWTERLLESVFSRLPAPAIGAVLASVCLLLSQLLAGPRPNIYFSF
jgi:alginate O-acetyltransferase complex protein AlgI